MVSAPLTLHSIQTRAVEVPMATPLATSAQTMNSAPILLIDMQTEEGIVGRAYLFCYTRMAPGLIATVLTDIADALHGERIAPVDFSSRLPQRYRLLGERRRLHRLSGSRCHRTSSLKSVRICSLPHRPALAGIYRLGGADPGWAAAHRRWHGPGAEPAGYGRVLGGGRYQTLRHCVRHR